MNTNNLIVDIVPINGEYIELIYPKDEPSSCKEQTNNTQNISNVSETAVDKVQAVAAENITPSSQISQTTPMEIHMAACAPSKSLEERVSPVDFLKEFQSFSAEDTKSKINFDSTLLNPAFFEKNEKYSKEILDQMMAKAESERMIPSHILKTQGNPPPPA